MLLNELQFCSATYYLKTHFIRKTWISVAEELENKLFDNRNNYNNEVGNLVTFNKFQEMF